MNGSTLQEMRRRNFHPTLHHSLHQIIKSPSILVLQQHVVALMDVAIYFYVQKSITYVQDVCTTCDVIVQENDDGIVVVNKGQRDKMNNTKILCLHCYEVRSLCKYLPETLRHCETTELSLLRSKLSSLKSRGEMTECTRNPRYCNHISL